MWYKIQVALLLFNLITINEALRILVWFPAPSKSHSILGHGVVDRVLEAGHEVVHITSFLREKTTPKLIELNTPSVYEFLEKMRGDDIFQLKNMVAAKIELSSFFIAYMSYLMTTKVMQEPGVKKLLNDPKEKFDVIILHWFFSELNIGLIVIPLETWVYNSIYTEFAAKRGVTLPSYRDAIYNSSFMFMNSHPSIGGAIKLPQNAVNIAGFHIKDKVTPLPQDLQKLMDEAKHGVIYFSMGSNFLSQGMSDDMKSSLLNLFGKLDQTVIWKFESDLKDVPTNVHLVKWAPQPSILSHPNLRLFITHGGQLSTTEAIHYGVPLVGIPVMADQHINMASVVSKGFGIKVTLADDMAKELEVAIKEVLTNKSYKERAVELSTIYHDRPRKAGEELVYWVEYVVRARGAPHLRSPSLTVSLYQRLYLDLLALLILIAIVVRKIIRYILKMRRKESSQTKTKKNKKD